MQSNTAQNDPELTPECTPPYPAPPYPATSPETLLKAITERDQKIDALSAQLAEREQQLSDSSEQLQDRDRYIYEILNSRAWKLGHWLWNARLKLFPPGSLRDTIVLLPIRILRVWKNEGTGMLLLKCVRKVFGEKFIQNVARAFRRFIPRPIQNFYREYRLENPLVDRSKVVLYADPDVLPDYLDRQSLRMYPSAEPEKNQARQEVKVSLISTVLNEASSAKEWLGSLLLQSRKPDEVIITDGGSSDHTVEIIREFAQSFPIKITVIESPGANISRGRNIAIQNATFPLLVISDFGCTLDRDWLKNLVLPFEMDETINVSAGHYEADAHNDIERVYALFFFKDLESIEPQAFLPSSRSLAIKKRCWAEAGGYPEWLTDAGEDTLFDYQVKMQNVRWAFVPQAKVYWRLPHSLGKIFKTHFRYSQGNGEVGIEARNYWGKARQVFGVISRLIAGLVVLILSVIFLNQWAWLILAVLLTLGGLMLAGRIHFISRNWRINTRLSLIYLVLDWVVSAAQFLGFTTGVANRSKVRNRQAKYYAEQIGAILAKHPDRKGIIVYPPTHDWGFMFQLPQQMARAFAHKGYLYFYCTHNEKTDTVLGFFEVEPGLYLSHVPIETFKILKNPIVYVGSPWNSQAPSYFDHPMIIYDHYDDLQVSSGWFEDHLKMLREADVVLVTARRLLENIKDLRPDAIFAPSGVDYNRFKQQRPLPSQPIPEDWEPIVEKGKPVIGYSGAMAERFDYDLFRYIATARPDLEFVLIGVDYDGSIKRSRILEVGLGNVHWLGMKPYDELLQYMWRFDVGIVPFKINPITLATTSIKLFEYMACGKPVISTAMPESRRYPGVFIAETHEQFVELLDIALQVRNDASYLATIDQVVKQNTWDNRANVILERLSQVKRGTSISGDHHERDAG